MSRPHTPGLLRACSLPRKLRAGASASSWCTQGHGHLMHILTQYAAPACLQTLVVILITR